MPRDYGREEDRRNEIAQDHGWDSRAEQRWAMEQIADDPTAQTMFDDAASYFADMDPSEVPTDWQHAFYEAFIDEDTRDDRSADGAKAYWFVEMMEDFTYEEWEDLYSDA